MKREKKGNDFSKERYEHFELRCDKRFFFFFFDDDDRFDEQVGRSTVKSKKGI